jgi:2-polyprenyl-6-methoxyphenol hydroxylase-like FAD-dependent oxidoreductase
MSDVDVLVIGAGPAGCAAAIGSARSGLTTALLERAAFPRDRPGETLHPGVESLFRALGVANRILSRGFLRHDGHWVQWAGPARFEAFGGDASGAWRGFQAPRAELDAMLLERARDAVGAAWWVPAPPEAP